MIFDVAFKTSFIEKPSTTRITAECVRIQVTFDVVQYLPATIKFLVTTSYVALCLVNGSIMSSGFVQSFEFDVVGANVAFHGKEFAYLSVLFVFVTSTSRLCVRSFASWR